jgi:hypothetical protein
MEIKLRIKKRTEKKRSEKKTQNEGTNIMNMEKNTMQICTIFRERTGGQHITCCDVTFIQVMIGQQTLLLLMT